MVRSTAARLVVLPALFAMLLALLTPSCALSVTAHDSGGGAPSGARVAACDRAELPEEAATRARARERKRDDADEPGPPVSSSPPATARDATPPVVGSPRTTGPPDNRTPPAVLQVFRC